MADDEENYENMKLTANDNTVGPANMTLNVKKAGMEKVDVAKVNEIIMNASKGSKFYLRQQERQKEIEQRIKTMQDQLASFTQDELAGAEEKMNSLANHLESKRDLTRVIVHVDMDAFFAAVEIRDNPKLNDLPMAVGGLGMLSTSNYLARQYGVRAAMPGFIGKKLCPELVIVKPNFEKYTRVSEEVREVLAEFDENFCTMSLDEAYLEITDLVNSKQSIDCDKSREKISEEIVEALRQQIFQRTNLTCSAGIAPNARLAKVCSNMNKPNGQFCLAFSRSEVMKFISSLPIGKICGIGNVSEQMLNALGVTYCKDLWNKRAEIFLLFSNLTAESYLSISLGLGSTRVKSDENRKSISVERTFRDTSDVAELKKTCNWLCLHLSEDLNNEAIVGKVVTLKLKTSCYHVRTRAKTLANYTSNAEQINTTAQQLLEQEIKSEQPNTLTLRLMGVRMSSLIFKSSAPKQQQQTLDNVLSVKKQDITMSSEVNEDEDPPPTFENAPSTSSAAPELNKAVNIEWTCPLCDKVFANDNPKVQNNHIDECLNKQTIKEVLLEDNSCTVNPAAVKRSYSPKSQKISSKRKKVVESSIVKTIPDYFKADGCK